MMSGIEVLGLMVAVLGPAVIIIITIYLTLSPHKKREAIKDFKCDAVMTHCTLGWMLPIAYGLHYSDWRAFLLLIPWGLLANRFLTRSCPTDCAGCPKHFIVREEV